MHDLLRKIFGIRQKRKALPASAVPAVGASLIRDGITMKVTVPLDEELWDWMLLSDWRVVNVRHERRSHVKLPDSALKHLVAANHENRAKVHAHLIQTLSTKSK
ncbi:hypothetical protein [Undibacterium sp. Ren11W]|uniref:hypothetical protein n=1 Tax=Undibacterium sp. Ren11W TaxID=3413045 RepID=UPI003BEFFFD6